MVPEKVAFMRRPCLSYAIRYLSDHLLDVRCRPAPAPENTAQRSGGSW